MSSIGTGYDLSVSTYSPDGRLFQVEYASKAVEAAGVAVGLRCSDGVVLGVERLLHSKLLVKGSNRRIQSVDDHIGMATAGLLADGKHLAERGRDEASNFRDTYAQPVTVQILSDRLSAYVQAYTCYGSVRPFGISTLVGGVDKTGSRLFCIEPSGVFYGYRATAVGKGRALARTELEKVLGKVDEAGEGSLTVRQGVLELARIIHLVHDDNKDKEFELELTWVCEESGNKHALVPADLLAEADAKGRAALEEGMEED
ncbi:proteasome subunit alpha type 3 [Naematelia encephala]|uniref:Proteasome subunit alpha type n=1 Tax=Naematelia encephala TaxID=71784 RepID=A0A1Y2AJK5_9TREE|nr:proteasome subunit alpha type 3 [Naematelia encephala]